MLLISFLYFQNSGGGETTVCCGGVILVIVVIIVVAVNGAKEQAKVQARQRQILAEARAAYQDSLAKLKADPTSSNLREATLHFGRTYSNLTRNNKGVTIFDEVALANDINAACGGATRLAEDKRTPQTQTIESRLQKLADLKSNGLIDEQEYASRRQKILDEV
jgi:hypothetical protein